MILGRLKEETKEQHVGLEKTVDVMNRMFNMDDYKMLLCKNYRFYSTIEPVVADLDWSKVNFNFEERRKTGRIREDLKNLGVSDEEIDALPPWESLPALDTHAKAFGSLYVMEGATLGGQVINRHLKEHLGLTPENGGSFFNGYGKETGPMWKDFGMAVTAFSEANDAGDTIVESAKATFDSYKKCFEDSLDISLGTTA